MEKPSTVDCTPWRAPATPPPYPHPPPPPPSVRSERERGPGRRALKRWRRKRFFVYQTNKKKKKRKEGRRRFRRPNPQQKGHNQHSLLSVGLTVWKSSLNDECNCVPDFIATSDVDAGGRHCAFLLPKPPRGSAPTGGSGCIVITLG